MAQLGSATFAWQSDYGQFYLVDADDPAFAVPVEIAAELEARRLFAPASGLVVYTNDCLQQHLRIVVHDAEPDHQSAEMMSGNPWTQIETAAVTFPSRSFGLSSPSMPGLSPAGPVFILPADTLVARVSWMEFQGSRDDSVPVEPDVIEVALWPAPP